MKINRWYTQAMVFLAVFLMVVPVPAFSQDSAGGAPAKSSGPAFRPEKIEQMLAPIALYPDSLLAQVFVASTYPLEIVQADRLVKQNQGLKGDELLKAAKDKDWDPSVKAMLQFPSVLGMMSEKLDWTTDLGDAFLSQQKDVMDAVQRLRKRAYDAGNLKTSKEQVVKVQAAQTPTQVIVIEPAQPQVVYVPAPNPTVVYGAWPYPAYPPYPYYPPGYTVGVAALGFAAGVAVGASYGAWGAGWGHGDVTINANQYNNFSKNNYVNAQKYQANKNQNWQHNPEHRKGAQYRDPSTAQRYGQGRGQAGARPGTSDSRGYGQGAGDRGARPQTGDMKGGGDRGARPQTADMKGGGRGGAGGQGDMARSQQGAQGRSGGRESAFGGGNSGGGERAASFRGEGSRGSQPSAGGMSRGGGGGGGGGGGFSRGGGGGGGGGSRGGGGGGGGRGRR